MKKWRILLRRELVPGNTFAISKGTTINLLWYRGEYLNYQSEIDDSGFLLYIGQDPRQKHWHEFWSSQINQNITFDEEWLRLGRIVRLKEEE